MEISEFKNEKIKEFFKLKVANLAEKTQKSKMYAISKFLDIIGNINLKDIQKNHILKYIESEYFSDLKNSSKNLKIIHISTFLKYYERNDLIDLFPSYNEKKKELDKTKLISRDDLEKILKSAGNIKYKTMVMLLYESAIRKSELLGIKKENLQFLDEYCNLYIEESKSMKRNIPLVETIPYLREYFNKYNFSEEDPLFDYNNSYINEIINKIEKRTKQKYPSFKKELTPHLFRHSRLTELASNRRLNEPQLRKFAGWSKSSNMPSIYFHLDDSSIRNEIISQSKQEKPKKPKKIGFQIIRCPNCNEFNNKFNEFCWKCGKIINKDLVAKKIKEQERLGNLEKENKQLQEKIDKMEETLIKVPDLLNAYNSIKKLLSQTLKNKEIDLDLLEKSIK